MVGDGGRNFVGLLVGDDVNDGVGEGVGGVLGALVCVDVRVKGKSGIRS